MHADTSSIAMREVESAPDEVEDWVHYSDHAAVVEQLAKALEEIEAIASGSTTANSLPHIAKLAHAAIAAAKEAQ